MWGKHAPSRDRAWHNITRIETGGSVHLRCAGRWSTSDEWREDESPPTDERCRACDAPTASMRGIVQMDLSDLDEPAGGGQ